MYLITWQHCALVISVIVMDIVEQYERLTIGHCVKRNEIKRLQNTKVNNNLLYKHYAYYCHSVYSSQGVKVLSINKPTTRIDSVTN